MKVEFKLVEGIGFQTTVQGKANVNIKEELFDRGDFFAPTEYLLLAVGSCTGSDVILILSKMKVRPSEFSVTVEAERETEIPRTLKTVNIHYKMGGLVEPSQALKAVLLSLRKYCSVSILVERGGAHVTFSLSVNNKLIYDHRDPKNFTDS
ncbi:MAG: OsmC family protein [Thermoplasmata archaeon]